MAEEVVEAEESKPKKPIVMIALAAVVLVILLAGAIGGTLFATGFFDKKDKQAAEAALAELEAKGGAAAGKAAAAASGAASGAGGQAPAPKAAASMQRFEYRYYEMEKDLVANLTGSKKVMQIKLAIMTRYDDRVTNNVKKHEFALRSVALDVMRQTKPEDIDQPDFRKRLAERIRDELNLTLQKFEDFGGIEEVMFTNFITQ